MPFWDRFVLSIYLVFRGCLVQDQPAGASLLDVAFQRGHLNPAQLAPLSVVALAATCSPGTGLRTQIDARFTALRLHLPGAAAQVQNLLHELALSAARLRLEDATALYRLGSPDQSGQAAQLLQEALRERLVAFLSHRYLVDPTAIRGLADRITTQALGAYSHIPFGTIGLPVHLFRRLPHALHGAPPRAVPVRPPAWLAAQPDDLWLVMTCYARLSEDQRTLLYFAFYGELDVGQIRELFSLAADWTDEEVVDQLRQCWEAVLA